MASLKNLHKSDHPHIDHTEMDQTETAIPETSMVEESLFDPTSVSSPVIKTEPETADEFGEGEELHWTDKFYRRSKRSVEATVLLATTSPLLEDTIF